MAAANKLSAIVRGRVDLSASVLQRSAILAAGFCARMEAYQFVDGPIEILAPPRWLPDPEVWWPELELEQLGMACSPPLRSLCNLVVTIGCDQHIDNIDGQTLALVLFNDGLKFRQGRAWHVTQPGEWFIFDDRLMHGVKERASSTSYLCWCLPLQPHKRTRRIAS